MRIAFLLVKHPPDRQSPIMPEVFRRLGELGHQVDLLYPEEDLVALADVTARHDLYVLKSQAEAALSVAGALHALGARLLNPYPAAAALRDKVISTRMLQAAGLPVPATFLAGTPAALLPRLAEGPLVLKPVRGWQGRGVQVVRTEAELRAYPADGLVFAQRFHPPDGADLKLYGIGGRVFGVRRVWPPRTYEEKLGEPFVPDAALQEIVLRCGAALGVELFGVDVIESGGARWVVDMQGFPGFKGVPDAARLLAEAIDRSARG